MIICVVGSFDIYDRNGNPTGRKEMLVSHAYDYTTNRAVIVPCEHPVALGAVINRKLNEYVLYESEEEKEFYM